METPHVHQNAERQLLDFVARQHHGASPPPQHQHRILCAHFTAADDGLRGGEECPVCAEDDNEEFVELNCGHRFHRECFETYHQSQLGDGRQVLCPLCRAPVRFYTVNGDGERTQVAQPTAQQIARGVAERAERASLELAAEPENSEYQRLVEEARDVARAEAREAREREMRTLAREQLAADVARERSRREAEAAAANDVEVPAARKRVMEVIEITSGDEDEDEDEDQEEEKGEIMNDQEEKGEERQEQALSRAAIAARDAMEAYDAAPSETRKRMRTQPPEIPPPLENDDDDDDVEFIDSRQREIPPSLENDDDDEVEFLYAQPPPADDDEERDDGGEYEDDEEIEELNGGRNGEEYEDGEAYEDNDEEDGEAYEYNDEDEGDTGEEEYLRGGQDCQKENEAFTAAVENYNTAFREYKNLGGTQGGNLNTWENAYDEWKPPQAQGWSGAAVSRVTGAFTGAARSVGNMLGIGGGEVSPDASVSDPELTAVYDDLDEAARNLAAARVAYVTAVLQDDTHVGRIDEEIVAQVVDEMQKEDATHKGSVNLKIPKAKHIVRAYTKARDAAGLAGGAGSRDRVVYLGRSSRPGKKYMVRVGTDGPVVHFGQHGAPDFTTHHDVARQIDYLRRHRAHEDWTRAGVNTPGFWARWLLWSRPSKREAVKYIERKMHARVRPFP